METKGDKMPPGFRFHPTDVELLAYYLKRKVNGKKLHLGHLIPEMDVYNYEPWELAGLPDLNDAKCMYFFVERVSSSLKRVKRDTKSGYWKVTGKKRDVHCESRLIGSITTLLFHSGLPPRGDRTDWVMHEYKLADDEVDKGGTQQGTFVLCKIFKKSGFLPGAKQEYGASFSEAEWLDGDNEVAISESCNKSIVTYVAKDDNYPEQGLSSLYTQLSDFPGLENQDSHRKKRGKQAFEHENEVDDDIYYESQVFEHVNEVEDSILFDSYRDLESSVKKTLLLFGEGYEFEKETLIQLWMALEFTTDAIMFAMDESMEAIGGNYFEKFVAAGYILCSVANSLYKVNVEKLNTIVDSVTDKQNYVILGNGSQNDDLSTETLHVSIICDELDEAIFKKLGKLNNLRSLLFIGNYGSKLQQVPRDLFLCYRSLVALDLSGTHIKELPCTTREMIHLRYLDLSWTFIERLPERIDRFQVLETLKLKGCAHLCKLPKEMKKVIKLRHLQLDVLRQLTAFPKGMGALVNLRTLSAFPVGSEEGHKISELKYLNNLTGEFCIAKLENVESAEEAKEASLMAKLNIRKLELRWSRCQFQGPNNEHEAILENLRPCSNLEEMQVLCYQGSRLPSWVADVSFHKLVSLALLKCKNVSILPSLEKLPSLESLELDGFSSLTKMDWSSSEVDHVAFPKLQKLAIDGMPNLEAWTKADEDDYPCLVELSIKDCPKLHELPSLLYLPSLENVEVSGCTKFAFVPDKQLSASLKQLIVEECPLIKEKCLKQGGQDWYKIQHVPTIWMDQVAIQPAYEDDWEGLSEEDDDESAGYLHTNPLSIV